LGQESEGLCNSAERAGAAWIVGQRYLN
jgi:hypothetical protein